MDKRFRPWSAIALATGLVCAGCSPSSDGGAFLPTGDAHIDGPGADAPGNQSNYPQATGDPGRVTLHRLNRAEYNNTVRDLLGTALTPADDFPNDDHGYGYDNIADVLSMSPLLFELYEHAAELLVEEAMDIPIQEAETFFIEAEEADHTTGGPYGTTGWNIWSNGDVNAVVDLPADGTYILSAYVWGQQAGPEVVHMAFTLDGLVVAEFDVPDTVDSPGTYAAEFEAQAGLRQVGVAFTNDFYEPDEGLDRNLLIDWFRVKGPVGLSETDKTNPRREAIVICNPTGAWDADCARQILAAFGRRAWRRPLTDGELDALVDLASLAIAEGDDFDKGISLALRAILVSHHFVFRVETDADPLSSTPQPLNQHELASRISYFLWSSMPDEILLAAADAGALSELGAIDEQVRRMLKSPRSRALVDNFGGQWLYIRAIDDVIPDPWYFEGAWSEDLRQSMRAEAWLFFHSFLSGNRSMLELLDATDSFVDQRLADHYGLETFGALPGAFVEMEVSGAKRGGLLRQGALLTALSYPTRTSPVRRGKWVLGHLLCEEPPPPPPGVEGFAVADLEAKTLKEALAQHRSDPACAGCHASMDAIGLGLENYDGIGRWRDEDAGLAIDASGELPPDLAFQDADELVAILAADPRLPSCMAKQLFTYALGRGVEASDAPFIEEITGEFIARGHRFDELAVLIAQSAPFRMRRGEPEEGGE